MVIHSYEYKNKKEYPVAGTERTHIWLRSITWRRYGIYVSVSLYSKEQNNEITKTLHSLEKEDVVSAVLKSSSELPRKWVVNSISGQI